ncbi:unnamed protein product [Phytomonas sp. Hart1]|nr:unnamed protein product [Phytomonas sp. Hart1]|eukprot:CCW69424.1 unnamed protein product [Phytomonas sp. isolate Hart1]
MLTGIPREVEPEEFYAYLRSHLTHHALPALVNALLLRIPAEEGKEGGGRSTGAALVDFSSKAAAEAAMTGHVNSSTTNSGVISGGGGGGVYVAGVKLRWQPLGAVIAGEGSWAAAMLPDAIAAEQEGRRAYTAIEGDEKVAKKCQTSVDERRRTRKRVKEGDESNSSPMKLCKSEGGVQREYTLPLTGNSREEVVVRLVADRSLSKLYPFNRDGEVHLFSDIERELRRMIMGVLFSLQRISDTEVHINIDRETANYLQEKEETKRGSARLCSVVTTSTVNSLNHDTFRENYRLSEDYPSPDGLKHRAGLSTKQEEVVVVYWEVRHARPSLDIAAMLSNGNLSLASKSETLAAMARLMERTSGKFGAIRDTYGNLLFPN